MFTNGLSDSSVLKRLERLPARISTALRPIALRQSANFASGRTIRFALMSIAVGISGEVAATAELAGASSWILSEEFGGLMLLIMFLIIGFCVIARRSTQTEEPEPSESNVKESELIGSQLTSAGSFAARDANYNQVAQMSQDDFSDGRVKKDNAVVLNSTSQKLAS